MWNASGVASRCVEGRALAIVGCSVSKKRVEEISSMDRWWQQRGVQTSVPATSKVWCSLVAATCHANATCVWPCARGCLRSSAPDPWHLARHAAAFLAAINTNLSKYGSKYGQYRGGPGIVTGSGRGRSTRDVHTDFMCCTCTLVLHVYRRVCLGCVYGRRYLWGGRLPGSGLPDLRLDAACRCSVLGPGMYVHLVHRQPACVHRLHLPPVNLSSRLTPSLKYRPPVLLKGGALVRVRDWRSVAGKAAKQQRRYGLGLFAQKALVRDTGLAQERSFVICDTHSLQTHLE